MISEDWELEERRMMVPGFWAESRLELIRELNEEGAFDDNP